VYTVLQLGLLPGIYTIYNMVKIKGLLNNINVYAVELLSYIHGPHRRESKKQQQPYM
jgi:hypothetical protein